MVCWTRGIFHALFVVKWGIFAFGFQNWVQKCSTLFKFGLCVMRFMRICVVLLGIYVVAVGYVLQFLVVQFSQILSFDHSFSLRIEFSGSSLASDLRFHFRSALGYCVFGICVGWNVRFTEEFEVRQKVTFWFL